MTIRAPETDPGFKFVGTAKFIGGVPQALRGAALLAARAEAPADDLGPLAQLEGTWTGTGFNTIWRPEPLATSGTDRFLELNLTNETLAFTRIDGPIPNRGLLMPDINMFGLTYMQQITEASDGSGLHIEPGIWATVPATTDPSVDPTVVRMGSIPHGTVILAQGQAFQVTDPAIQDNNIIPFAIGSLPPANSDFDQAAATFTELDLSTDTQFRFASPGVTQDMVRNPNSVLQAAIANQTITSTTVLRVSTSHSPVPGGGTANTAFLEAGQNPPGGNADAVQVDAVFWIETVAGQNGDPDFLQLQYTQVVQLDFNGLRWPHVTVATLRLSVPGQDDGGGA